MKFKIAGIAAIVAGMALVPPVSAAIFYHQIHPITVHHVDQYLQKSFYVTGFNYHFDAPLFSAEHLTRDDILKTEKINRLDVYFGEDNLLPKKYRVPQSAWTNSGFQRGHLFSAGDAPTQQIQVSSFVTSNIVPQVGRNNNVSWGGMEDKVRKLTLHYNEAYVVSGAIYTDADKTIKWDDNHYLFIPKTLYKAVVLPKQKVFCVYTTTNNILDNYQILSGKAFYNNYKINPIPAALADGFSCKKSLFEITYLDD